MAYIVYKQILGMEGLLNRLFIFKIERFCVKMEISRFS